MLSPGRLLQIARRLDIHPADLVPELEPLLSHRRQALGEARGGQDRRADALTVLTALATARAPLSPTSSPAPGMAAAAQGRHRRRPGQPRPRRPTGAAPHPARNLDRHPTLDILTQARRRALRHLTGAAILDDDQARVLPAGQK